MRSTALLATVAGLAICGCSGSSPLTTGSLFGGASQPEKPAAPVIKNDPTSRAFQVGTVSARAVKCGYNFDPARLKSSFLAAEAAQGTSIADLASVERTYDVSFNGVTKAIANQPAYCSERKTAEIKQDLTRHLAGDYTPSAPRKVEEEDGGILSFGSKGRPDDDPITKHPMDDR